MASFLTNINYQKKMIKAIAVLVVVCWPLFALGLETLPYHREVRLVMGTTADIEVEGASLSAIDQAFQVIQQVDNKMSLWQQSELSKLNSTGEGSISNDLAKVLHLALEIAAASGGAFDPTIEPLVRAAGLLGDGPSKKGISSEVDYTLIDYAKLAQYVRLNGTQLDFGGIAKGYAVDKAMQVLIDSEVDFAMINLGQSSVKLYGNERTFGIKSPLSSVEKTWATFTIRNIAFATSSLAQRPGHIFDPRGVAKVANQSISVTVLSANAILADALSTAAFVLGPKKGIKLLADYAVDGIILTGDKTRQVAYTTVDFSEKYNMSITSPTVSIVELKTREKP